MRQAEPVAAASRLYRALAGETGSPARRTLATVVMSVAVVASIPALLAGVLALLAFTGIFLSRALPVDMTSGRLAVSWAAVSLITVAFLGVAVGVSWTSRRRSEPRPSEQSPTGPAADASATSQVADPRPET